MALSDAVAAIRSRAETLWPAIEPDVSLSFPNRAFETPRSSDGAPLPFVVIEVRWADGGFASVGAPGNNWARREGLIWIYAFIRQGIGSEDRAHELVSKMAAIYEGEDFGGVICQAMDPGGEADSEDGNLFGQSASVPFNFDEVR